MALVEWLSRSLRARKLASSEKRGFSNLDDARFMDFQMTVDDSNRRHAQTFG